MNTNILYPLIDEAVQVHKLTTPLFPDYFKKNLSNVAPIVWFGRLGSSIPKIITFGSNPSDKEFLDKNLEMLQTPRFPNSLNVHSVVASDIETDDNNYFNLYPYKSWFNPLHSFAQDYFGIKDCIHIDALPFATLEKFTKLDPSTIAVGATSGFACFGDVLSWGQCFARRLVLQIVQNDQVCGVLVSGLTNLKLFKTIFAGYINQTSSKSSHYTVNGRKYLIEKFYLQIDCHKIEVIGTSIYLPAPRIKGLNHKNLIAEIKKL